MRCAFTPLMAIVLCVAGATHAHRLDEYLQATTISVSRSEVRLDIRLAPGVQVWPRVLANIDTDKDGTLSDAELRSYAMRIGGDLALSLDGEPLGLRYIASSAHDMQAFKRGLGEIHVRFVAAVKPASAKRRLVFENAHERAIASYLVNSLVPADAAIRITGQHRNHEQSRYELEYVQQQSAPFG